jgi:hypothetical protein
MNTGTAATTPVGTWLVTPVGGPTGGRGRNLLTLTTDGPIVWSGGDASFTVQHGAWLRTGDRSARLLLLGMRRAEKGEIVERGRTTADVTFNAAFDEFDASVVTERSDAQGRQIDSFTFSSHAVRVTVDFKW